jgi:UDP-N-acetylglucosamine:LPS N-acetylglucosamine transferase
MALKREDLLPRVPGVESLQSRPTICLVSSPGGHLQQLVRFRTALAGHRQVLVTNRNARLGGQLEPARVFHVADINEGRGARNPILLIAATLQAARIVIVERPFLILSTGAGIAVPFFLLARITRTPSVYVESYTRIDQPSRSGRICRRLAGRYFVQHRELANKLPGARYLGSLYDNI